MYISSPFPIDPGSSRQAMQSHCDNIPVPYFTGCQLTPERPRISFSGGLQVSDEHVGIVANQPAVSGCDIGEENKRT